MTEPAAALRSAGRRGVRSTAALVGVLLLATACDGGPTEATVDGVSVSVPDGWERAEQGDTDGVVGSHRWTPSTTGDVRNLQVVVGCGGTVDELVQASAQSPRGPLVVTAAQEDQTEQPVPGLDTARRLALTLGAGRDDDAETLRVIGLYGGVGDTLVLVELSQPARASDDALADEVLDSVRVDADVASAACAGQE
ncbi:hypothetical protein [Egicoccus halophilus]|uniref:Uncharacterized protein n=1 Tax=Egicoccus halophilus TaxID=1670830 RepID=A0A8J3AF78_9ACTN|nr:hypothetical protein [Egicoccus halophilus]GGI07716.1 hypothetical protein GCM10011354_25480 [Egicoccus halophilus]